MPLTWTDSRVLSAQELTRLAAAIAGTYVVPTASGGAVSTSAAMTVAAAAITASTGLYVNAVQDTTGYAGGTTVIATADPTNPRRDYVWYDGAGAIGNTTGTPAANPVLPDLTAGRIALAEIYVTAGLATIASGNIIDRRANVAAVAVFFDSLRTAFRANRYQVGVFYGNSSGTGTGSGFGGSTTADNAGTTLSGEPNSTWASNGAAANQGAFSDAIASSLLSPNHSPRLLARVQHPAASANVTYYIVGFFISASATPTAMAGLRVVTTGNVFAVTRVAGTETTTDLGALSRTTVLGYEIETADAGVTWVIRNQAGTSTLATLTTNVPVAATGMQYGAKATVATGAIPWSVAHLELEATFT